MPHLNTSDESFGKAPSNSLTCTNGYYSLENCSEGTAGYTKVCPGCSRKYRDDIDAAPASSEERCYGKTYFNFLKDCRQRHPSMYNGHRVVNIVSQQWRAMSPHSRSQYGQTDRGTASSVPTADLVGCSDDPGTNAKDSLKLYNRSCGKSKEPKKKKSAVVKARGEKSVCRKTKKRSSKPKKICSKPKVKNPRAKAKAKKPTKKCAQPKKRGE